MVHGMKCTSCGCGRGGCDAEEGRAFNLHAAKRCTTCVSAAGDAMSAFTPESASIAAEDGIGSERFWICCTPSKHSSTHLGTPVPRRDAALQAQTDAGDRSETGAWRLHRRRGQRFICVAARKVQVARSWQVFSPQTRSPHLSTQPFLT